MMVFVVVEKFFLSLKTKLDTDIRRTLKYFLSNIPSLS